MTRVPREDGVEKRVHGAVGVSDEGHDQRCELFLLFGQEKDGAVLPHNPECEEHQIDDVGHPTQDEDDQDDDQHPNYLLGKQVDRWIQQMHLFF